MCILEKIHYRSPPLQRAALENRQKRCQHIVEVGVAIVGLFVLPSRLVLLDRVVPWGLVVTSAFDFTFVPASAHSQVFLDYGSRAVCVGELGFSTSPAQYSRPNVDPQDGKDGEEEKD